MCQLLDLHQQKNSISKNQLLTKLKEALRKYGKDMAKLKTELADLGHEKIKWKYD